MITTITVIKDDDLKINGSIYVLSGSLTLDNTTLLFQTDSHLTNRFVVFNGAELHIINGSYVAALDNWFVLLAAPESVLEIKDSTMSGLIGFMVGSKSAVIERSDIRSTYFGVMIVGGSLTARWSEFVGGNNGIWVHYGNLLAENNTFTGNGNGIIADDVACCINYNQSILENLYCMIDAPGGSSTDGGECVKKGYDWSGALPGSRQDGPRTVFAADNVIRSSSVSGIMVDASEYSPGSTDVTLLRNSIKESQDYGVFLGDGANLHLIDNEFSDARECMSVNSIDHKVTTLDMVNNDFFGCTEHALMFNTLADFPLNGNWTVNKAIHVDSEIATMMPIKVQSGGRLEINDTLLGFMPMLGKPLSVVVDNDGELFLNNSEVRIVGGKSTAYSLEIRTGGKAAFMNTGVYGAGYAWGSDGELSGIYSSGVIDVDESYIYDGFYGLTVGNGIATLRNTSLDNGGNGVLVDGGALVMYDSGIKRSDFDDIKVQKGTADLYSTGFDRDKVSVTGGQLSVYWNASISSTWQNGYRVGNVSYTVTEMDGPSPVVTGKTDDNGTSTQFSLREFYQTSSGRKDTTPHTIKGDVSGLTNTSIYPIIGDGVIPLAIVDTHLPCLNVTFPGLIVHQAGNPLVVNGTAWDNESGIDRVQWSLDQDLWNDVTGLAKWNFTTDLYNGTRPVYLRALDKAGNALTQTMDVTIDSTVPYLVVTFPKDWYVTNMRTVLVEGRAEAGATVTAGDMSVLTTDGSFRLVYVLEEGTNTIKVMATDDTGNINITYVHVIRDTTAPPLIVTNPSADIITNDRNLRAFEVMGTTEPMADLTINGNTAIVGPDGNFSHTLYISEGVNTINLLVSDDVGNQNATTRYVLLDFTAPVLSAYSPKEGEMTNITTIEVTGLTDPWANVSVSNGRTVITVKAGRDGRYETDIGLMEGNNNLTMTVWDAASNTRSSHVTVTLDTTPPEITFLGSTMDGMKTQDTFVFIEGQTEAGARLKMDGQLIHTGLTGLFSERVAVPFANNSIVFEAVDKAGNRNITVLHIQRETEEEGGGGSSSTVSELMMPLLILLIVIIILQWAGYTAFTRYRTKKAMEAAERKRAAAGYVKGDRSGKGRRFEEEGGMEEEEEMGHADDSEAGEAGEQDGYSAGYDEEGEQYEGEGAQGSGDRWDGTSSQGNGGEGDLEIEYVEEPPHPRDRPGPGGGGR